jgi:hypothetical protein
MKFRLDDDQVQDSAAQKVLDGVGDKYKSFSEYIAFQESDSVLVFLLKLLIKGIGILFMLAISPIVLVVLIIAVLVAL